MDDWEIIEKDSIYELDKQNQDSEIWKNIVDTIGSYIDEETCAGLIDILAMIVIPSAIGSIPLIGAGYILYKIISPILLFPLIKIPVLISMNNPTSVTIGAVGYLIYIMIHESSFK